MNGERIKHLRIERGYTLAQLSKKTGYTASFLSQVERNLKNPSLEALRKIADALDVALVSFLVKDFDGHVKMMENKSDDYDKYYFIGKNERKTVTIPEIGTEYQFITPIGSDESSRPNMTGFYMKISANHWVSEELITHKAEESTFVIKGRVEVHLGNKVYLLTEGDSFYIDSGVPHNYFNPCEDVSIILSYLSPPV